MRVVLDQVNPDDIRQFYPQNFQALEDLGIRSASKSVGQNIFDVLN